MYFRFAEQHRLSRVFVTLPALYLQSAEVTVWKLPAEASALMAWFGIDDPTNFKFAQDWASKLEAKNAILYCAGTKTSNKQEIAPPTPGSTFVCENETLPIGDDSKHLTAPSLAHV